MELAIYVSAIVAELATSGAILGFFLLLKSNLSNRIVPILVVLYVISFPFAWFAGVYIAVEASKVLNAQHLLGHSLSAFLPGYLFLGGGFLIAMTIVGILLIKRT